MALKMLQHHLFKSVSAVRLSIFRILFGLSLFFEAFRKLSKEAYMDYYRSADFYFSLFEPFPLIDINYLPFLFMGLMVFALFITAGIGTRLFSALYMIGYAYFFSLDLIFYNNHFYLIILLCFIFCIIRTDGLFSLRAFLQGKKSEVPAWHYYLLLGQIGIPYFFSGLAKLNGFWLSGQPSKYLWETGSRSWLQLSDPNTIEIASYLYQYTGLFFDLSIFFLLIWQRSWWLGIILAATFHIINLMTLKIGIFPYLMLGTLVLFIPDRIYRKFFRFESVANTSKIALRPLITGFLALYFIIQIIVPARHHLDPGWVDWTGISRDFSWRMKQVTKVIDEFEMRFKCDVGQDQFNFYIDKQLFMMTYQDRLVYKPEMILRFCEYLDGVHKKRTGGDLEIYAKLTVSLNGEEPKYLIKPNIDLTEVRSRNLRTDQWLEMAY